MRDLARMLGLSVNWATFQELEPSVRTGVPAAERVLRGGYWAYFAAHPVESIVPEEPGPHWSKMLDILMLTLLGGRQRTRREYEALLDTAGFSIEREIDTGADISRAA